MTPKISRFIWPVIGFCAVALSVWLLIKEFRTLRYDDVVDALESIRLHSWIAAIGATLVAYAALAGYDRIALMHLGKRLSWRFVTIASFTAYALSHNIGFSLLSGAVVRYRAYTSQGLTPTEVGVLVAFCSFTFSLGTLILGGLLLVIRPTLLDRFFDLPYWLSFVIGAGMLGFVGFYVLGSLLHMKSLRIGRFHLDYPRPQVVLRQLLVGPIEIIGAAAIIYFTLPADGNPGFIQVLAIFLASFSLALASHAPGGIGVLEYVFLSGLDEIDPARVVASLIIFRILYLLVPLAISLVVVLLFERRQWLRRTKTSES
jgi:uncharacterized membrane protein YbhN (UPF0104 family)